MKPKAEITKYRLDRWFQRFEEYWNSLTKESFIAEGRAKGCLQSLPSRFSEIYSQAVDRYLKRTAALEREVNVWGQAYFFGLRALGASSPTSEDAWNLAVDFPLDVGFSFQDELVAYVDGILSSPDTAEELLLASERTLSLLKLWDVGMSPWLLSRIVPRCVKSLFSALSLFEYPDDSIRRRVMTIGAEHCLEILGIGFDACESWRAMHEDEERATASRDGELRAYGTQIEQFEGILFILEAQQRLHESRMSAMEPAGWMERFEASTAAEIPMDKLLIIQEDDIARLSPLLDELLASETSRNIKDVAEVAESIRNRDRAPTVETILFILKNLETNQYLRDEIFDDWILQLDEQSRRTVVEWAARRTLENYLIEMEPILGERLPSAGFEMSDLEIVQQRSAEVSATSVRYDRLVEKLNQVKEANVTQISKKRQEYRELQSISPPDEL
jgi:hypothetical protein